MKDDREKDKNYKICSTNSRKSITKDLLKSKYIAENLSIKELADMYNISKELIETHAKDENWNELRRVYIQSGIHKIQNTQLQQAQKLLDLDNNLKSLKLCQLEKMMENYAAYYARHGHLFKIHPVSGEILTNDENIPIPIKIPDVAKEIRALKESVTVSEGMKQLLDKLELIVNVGTPIDEGESPDIIDITNFNGLFEREDNNES